MKKVLLFMAAGLFCTSAFAQMPDFTVGGYPVDNQTTTEPAVKLNPGAMVDGELKEGSFGQGGFGYVFPTTPGTTPYQSVTINGEVFTVEFCHKATGAANQYDPFGISMEQWKAPEDGDANSPKFMVDAEGNANAVYQSAVGMTVDFSIFDAAAEYVNAEVSMDVLCDKDINVRVDVQSIDGTTTNAAGLNASLTGVTGANPATSKWTKLRYSWNNDPTASATNEYDVAMMDLYSPKWLEEIAHPSAGVTAVPVKADAIKAILITLDDGSLKPESAADEVTKNFYVKNVVIGAGYNKEGDYVGPTEYMGYGVSIDDVVAAPSVLEPVNGVFYSEGNITVTNLVGQVVTVVANELSIASLPAGTYFVTAAEGAAKIVK